MLALDDETESIKKFKQEQSQYSNLKQNRYSEAGRNGNRRE